MSFRPLPSLLVAGLFGLVLSGCGGDSQPDAAAKARGGDDGDRVGSALPTAAIGGDQAADDTAPPPKGSPEWLLLEIARLRVDPVPKTNDAEDVAQEIRRRNLKIIELAEQAIAGTHRDQKRERVFDAAVHHLVEARVQLALTNDSDAIKTLYEDVAALHRRDPKSRAAAEAAFQLVEFTQEMARRHVEREPRWLTEFARQARLFAAHHPGEQGRAVAKLDSAGWSCEVHGRIEDALGCYRLIGQQFPDTPQAKQVATVLRRLELPGKPLRLAGPTFDGGFLDVERDYAGKVVLVVFWDTLSRGCREQLATIAAVSEQYRDRGLEVVGVNLDHDELAVERLLESGEIDWPAIFYVEPEQRRWNNPLVRYYGVRDIPMLWLVGRDGIVMSTQVAVDDLEQQIEPLLAR
ncbi:MAG: TlpA family protein disulfide reductase [Planctomycetes bacterium]|nr:TlpA family protein disulfide reductase [Planctomycetota bacterium]